MLKRRVLIVDDNDVNRSILKHMLCSDYELCEAQNGQEALDLLAELHESISAILLDIIMPVMDGYTFLHIMRGDKRFSQIPVIVTTGDSEASAEIKALTLGANDFATKPYNPELIKRRLWNLVNLRENAAIVNAIRTDPLTGLYNRVAFFEKAGEMMAKHEAGYYIMSCFDIDGFKVINDQFGSEKGDEVLKFVADTFAAGFESQDGICCRVMADKFAVLYPKCFMDSDGIAKIRAKAAALDGSIPPITFSIGRYIASDLSLSASAMYDRAVLAEESIKGRFDVQIAYFDESMRQRVLQQQIIVSEMKQALATGQFEVWFQPQYNHANSTLIGAEALVRWRHPQRGLIPPNDFIPVFEKNGFVYELDKYVWEQTCICLRKWIDEKRSPNPVSVNLSRYDILRNDLFEYITGLIAKYDLPVDKLRLEITESAFAKSTEKIISVVQKLVDYGFTVEIDDFGSGYSSLNTLKDVPAQVVKLDMRFLEGKNNSARGGNILESIVRMTKWLGMSVIAEGVETKEQADYLKSIGCNYIQGYFYARPMTVSDYENLASKVKKEGTKIVLETVQNLDNNSFWDPDSMDTLIFNSYVGGACIYEYHNANIELLRATDKYAEVIGSAGMTVDDALKLDWAQHLDENTLHSLISALELSVDTKEEVTGEYVFVNLPGCPEKTYLRSTMRVIASVGDRYLVFCTNENITAQRIAEQNQREYERMLHDSATQIQAIMDNIESGVTAAVLNDGQIKFIFANNKYYELLGYTKELYDKEVTDIFSLIVPEYREEVREASLSVYKTGNPITHEYRVRKRDGSVIWVRIILSIAEFQNYSEPVQLSVIRDITTEKVALQTLHDSDEQLKFLNDTAHDLLAQTDTEKGIEGVLNKLLNFFGGKRAYIFEFDRLRETATNTYEICADGVKPEKENLQAVPLEYCNFWFQSFKHNNYIIIDDVSKLDETRSQEKALLEAQNIQSLGAAPLRRDGKLLGIIGVDDPSIRLSLFDRLSAIGDYLSVMLTRRDLDAKIKSDNTAMRDLMEGTPGGFARWKLLPNGNMSANFVNDGYCNQRGMTRAEIMRRKENAIDDVHPDDVSSIRESVQSLIMTGENRRLKYRVRHKNGSYVWVLAYGKISTSSDGTTFINTYYTDLSAQEQRKLSLTETVPFILNAIMKFSSDLSFAKDKDFRYICCSEMFAGFAGRKSSHEVVGKTDYDLFDKDVADKFRSDDIGIIESGKSIVDMIEPIPSNDGVPHYSSTSKYLLRDTAGEIIGIYGIGRDITEYRTAFEQLKLLTNSIAAGLATYSYTNGVYKLLYFNDTLCSVLGYTRDEYTKLTQQNVSENVSKEDLPALRIQLAEMMADNTPVDFYYRANTKDGTVKWLNIQARISERKGDMIIFNTVITDVTKAKNNEQVMRLATRLVDDSSTAVYVCDTETHKLLYVNSNCAKMCGRTVNEAEGMTCYKYLKGCDKPCEPCYMDLSNEKEYTTLIYTSSTTNRHYATRGKIIDWGGKRALVEYLNDETEHINAQKLLSELTKK